MNNTKPLMTDINPEDAINLVVEIKPVEKQLPEDGFYRYFYQPGEKREDQKRSTTNFIWCENTYRLKKVLDLKINKIRWKTSYHCWYPLCRCELSNR